MTERLFWEDPYATRCDATVLRVTGDDIELDRTVFFAFSGGQESDAGFIGGKPVLNARLERTRLIYTLPSGHGLSEGDFVNVEIDWSRRYALMRLHFAAELVLEMVCQSLVGVGRIGAHIAQDKARIDFEWHESIAPLLPRLTDEVTTLVNADLPIRSAFSDHVTRRRFWEVEGVAKVPCGGTHLRRTGEVGKVLLKRKNVGRSKERVEIRLADPSM